MYGWFIPCLTSSSWRAPLTTLSSMLTVFTGDRIAEALALLLFSLSRMPNTSLLRLMAWVSCCRCRRSSSLSLVMLGLLRDSESSCESSLSSMWP